jgi:hypothetical protein
MFHDACIFWSGVKEEGGSVKSILWRSARYFPAFFRGRGGGRGLGLALLLLVVSLGGGSALADDASTVEARQYSAYSDPEKPAISNVLSEGQNVAEFQEKFALSDEELDTVLAAIRKENEALARAQGESRRIVESNEGQPAEQVKGKIDASGYDEKIRKAIARTKVTVERVLPAERRPEFRAWVDERWLQEGRDAREEADAITSEAATSSSGRWFKVFATQYDGYTRNEVAMPHRKLKFDGGYKVYLSRSTYEGWAPVKEVGPWNTYDNWWDRSRKRTMWKDLPRGLPEAEAAYYDNYNRGRDEFGRKVLIPAGIDLTPAVAAKLGLGKYENA